MPIVNINFSNAQFDLIAPGTYAAVLEFIELKEKKDGSGQYLNWQLTITDEKYMGRKFWILTNLGEKSQWVIAKNLKALGVAAEGDELALEIDDDSGLLINPPVNDMNCYLKIEITQWNGVDQNRGSIVPAPVNGNGSSSIKF